MIEVDLTNYRCPMPLIKLKKVLTEHSAELEFKLFLSDPAALKDVPAFCHQMNLQCETDDSAEILVIWVRR
ncbi:sulfurtransferase TusA family protein [Thiomicrospira sp. R3]|uniref:sulfurtransferase TusA family protein n=1 Tax=Thiomicrospira sp. R3 TaxID=3035472 RepID=UPI00338DDD82